MGLLGPAETHTPLGGMLYKVLDLSRLALGGGTLRGSGPQWLVHHAGSRPSLLVSLHRAVNGANLLD